MMLGSCYLKFTMSKEIFLSPFHRGNILGHISKNDISNMKELITSYAKEPAILIFLVFPFLTQMPL